jgi:hypothetical protein
MMQKKFFLLSMLFTSLFLLTLSSACGVVVQETSDGVDGQDENSSGDEDTLNPDADSEMDPITLDNLTEKASKGICEALTRCCDTESQKLYFDPFRDNEGLADWAPMMPTDEPIDYDSCVELLNGIFPKIWLGSWLQRAESDEVTFQADAAETCLTNLNNAECGEEIQNTLFDPTCFGSAAPYGDNEQRLIFSRIATAGDSCQAIRDGFGGLYFGSCDPTVAFCCIAEDALEGGCSPYPSLDTPGTCQRASQLGEACNDLPIQLCRTGLVCNNEIGLCEEEQWDEIQIGEPCMEGANYLGACINSYCDFSTQLCEPIKENEESCTYGFECQSGWCEQTKWECIDNPICMEPEIED